MAWLRAHDAKLGAGHEVEDEEMANVEVILLRSVPTAGRAGDVVRVSAGYARNYLLPRDLAVHATESNRTRLAARLSARRASELKDLTDAQDLADVLNPILLVLEQTAGESGRLFGSVTTADIADTLTANSIEVDRRRIQLADPIRELGIYSVDIRLHPEVTATIQVEVVLPEGEEAQA